MPGVTIGQPMRKMGQRGIVNAEVFLDNVRVPASNRIGEEGKGFYGLMRTFDASRILIGAGATGLSRAALDATRAVRPGARPSSASRSSSTRRSRSGSPTWPPARTSPTW